MKRLVYRSRPVWFK